MRNISPQGEERDKLYLGDFFYKGKRKSADDDVEDVGDEFVDPSASVKCGSFSHFPNEFSSEFERVMIKQESICKELNDMKWRMNKNFENVFSCLKMLMKKFDLNVDGVGVAKVCYSFF